MCQKGFNVGIEVRCESGDHEKSLEKQRGDKIAPIPSVVMLNVLVNVQFNPYSLHSPYVSEILSTVMIHYNTSYPYRDIRATIKSSLKSALLHIFLVKVASTTHLLWLHILVQRQSVLDGQYFNRSQTATRGVTQ